MEDTSLLNSVATFMSDGGVFMWIILAIWLLGLVIAFERALKLFVYDIDGASFMNEVQTFIINNDVKGAIKACTRSQAFIPRIFKNALKRANLQSQQIQNAIEATVMECILKAERRFGYLGLLANLSTLMGLLGTIYGLIQSFEAVAAVDPSQKAEILASGISKAMNTTALGLISAMSIMVLNSMLSSKQEKIIGEMDEYSIKLLDLVSVKNDSEAKS